MLAEKLNAKARWTGVPQSSSTLLVFDQTTSFASVADDARVRTDTGWSNGISAVTGDGLGKSRDRYRAIRCFLPDCGLRDNRTAVRERGRGERTRSPPAPIYGCREVDLVAIREPVDEPSRRTGAGAAELPPRR